MSQARLIHVIDDEDAVRRSAAFMLKTSGFTVETWETGVAFLKGVRHADPGCILLDVRMPEMDGLEVQQKLREMGVMMPVIVLTGHGDISIAVRAMKNGAVDFIEKPIDKTVLLDAIGAAFERLDASSDASVKANEADVALAALSPRELEVLEGLARGLPNKTIAYDLGISARTVEVHRSNLMIKLGARTLSDTLRIAFAGGMGTGATYDYSQ